jgi:hypothetical protein
MISRPVCLGIKHPSGAYDQIFITLRQLWFVDVGRSLWREDGSVVYNCFWPSPAQSFSSPSPMRLVTIFYCLRFGTSLFVAFYDLQDYGGGVRPSLHKGSRYIPSIQTAQKTWPPTALLLLLACVAAITWRLMSKCLTMGVLTEPFRTNGCLFWLHTFGFQQTCQNM